MKLALVFLLFLTFILRFAEGGSQDCASMKDSHKQCPFHNSGHKEMNERGNQVMGFSQENTTHHFILEKNGGKILVEAKDPEDKQTIEQIRTHLNVVASSFAAGDFSMPHSVHLQVALGVEELTTLKSKIRYEYSETKSSGSVLITTEDEKALAAIHEFLKFQIQEHETGDLLQAW